MSTLRWARASSRHVAHAVWWDFARPSHGHFPTKDDREYVTACEAVIDVREHNAARPANWACCRACVRALSAMLAPVDLNAGQIPK